MAYREKSFLGRGWSFPPRFDANTGDIHMVSEEEDIRQSLYILLTTIPGERVMWPLFGCDLFSQVFTRIDTTEETYLKGLITDAILHFEPRITLEEIFFNEDDQLEGRLNIHLTYIIRKTNSRSNMVFPFYLKEGTHISLV